MFNNVILDVVLGLVFIFLLYSLLATILMEFIAHAMHLRARLLIKALRRMLEDNQPEIFGVRQRLTFIDFFSDVKESIKRYFLPFKNLLFLQKFYNHPTIKYLGESRSSSKPSYMQATNFSTTMIQIFRGEKFGLGESQLSAVTDFLFNQAERINNFYQKHKHWIVNADYLIKQFKKKNLTQSDLLANLQEFHDSPLRYNSRKVLIRTLITELQSFKSLDAIERRLGALRRVLAAAEKRKVPPDTLRHFQNLFKDAQNDLDRFKQRLEIWFDETMERTTGWYKRQTQVILLCIGLVIAIWGNVDALKIYKILSKDKKAREQLVNMAMQAENRYGPAIETVRKEVQQKDTVVNDTLVRTVVVTTGDKTLDSAYKTVQNDIAATENLLGTGWCSSDSCKAIELLEATCDSLEHEFLLWKEESAALRDSVEGEIEKAGKNPDASLTKYRDSIAENHTTLSSNQKTKIADLEKLVNRGYSRFRDDWNGWSVVGWLITAFAISLGAPFWFDMLSKVIKLRSSGARQGTNTNQNTTDSKAVTVPPIIRKG